MKERPILFSGPMVRAILEGRKTQTRRVVKPQPRCLETGNGFKWFTWPEDAPVFGKYAKNHGFMPDHLLVDHCPYGKPGDLLWVRETAFPDFPKDFSYYDWTWAEVPDEYRTPAYVLYQASSPDISLRWKPSIHMPRHASRLTLRITGIRVERVQSISEADALAEGCDWGQSRPCYNRYGEIEELLEGDPPQLVYCNLWNSIHLAPKPRYGRVGGKRVITHYEAFPWNEWDFDACYHGARESGTYRGKPLTVYLNPWVWVISYERREEATHA